MTTDTYEGQTLRWRHHDAALEVELCHGPCNEIGLATLDDFEALVAYLNEGAGGARALIWYSSLPSGFSAGADLRALFEGLRARREAGVAQAERIAEVRHFLDRIHRVFNAFDMAPITTLAATHSVVFGGGFELALTADIIIADKTSRFCFPELRLGLVPGFGGIPRLERDVGGAVIRDLLLSGRSLRAKRALELGLVSQVVAKGEALAVSRRMAAQAARFDATTTAATKRFMKKLPAARLEEEKNVFCELMASPVVEAALDAFVHSEEVMPYLPKGSS